MNITITKSELSKALSLTQSIVDRKTTMPILMNVLLSAGEGRLKVAATDLEITAHVSVEATVKSSGSTTVNAKILSDVVRELPDGDVTIKLGESERLEIVASSSQFRVIGVSAEEFPSLPGLSVETSSRLPARDLLDMISKTIYAVSHDETRFNLNGVCFEMHQEGKGKSATQELRLVATDGHRLAYISRPIDKLKFDEGAIVPTKGLSELKKVLELEGDGEIGLGVSDGFVVVETRMAKLSMRLIDGEFPDYNQVLPKKKGTIAEVSCALFTQALRRAALMVTDKGKGVRLDFKKGTLRVSSSSPELGESSEEIEIQYGGEDLTIGFNARYLLDFASTVEEERNVSLELSGELGPARLRISGDESYFGIVMPMRLA